MRRGDAALRERFAALQDFDRDFAPAAWAAGRFAGVDEAGVGPLAGPVVAAAVILPPDFDCPELDDSKRLRPAARARCEAAVRERALALALARVSPAGIDRINIRRAMLRAHRLALGALAVRPEVVLVDGNACPDAPPGWDDVRIATAVGGDARSLAVAAASVLAKNARDRIMVRLDARFPAYGFARHKGYATADHRAALRQLGLSPVHRRSFCGWLDAERTAARQGTLGLLPGR